MFVECNNVLPGRVHESTHLSIPPGHLVTFHNLSAELRFEKVLLLPILPLYKKLVSQQNASEIAAEIYLCRFWF